MSEALQYTSERGFSELSPLGEVKRAEVLARDLPTMLLTRKDMMGRPDLNQNQARGTQRELEARRDRLGYLYRRATPVPGEDFHARVEVLQHSRPDLQKLAAIELGPAERRVRLSPETDSKFREAFATLVGNITFRVSDLFSLSAAATTAPESKAAAEHVIGELQALVGGEDRATIARRIGLTLEAAVQLSGPRSRQEPLPQLAASYRERLTQVGEILNLRGSARSTLQGILDRLSEAN